MADSLTHPFVYPTDHWPAEWQVTSRQLPLGGAVDVAFTRGAVPPDGAAVWWPAVWTDGNTTALVRVAQLIVAGSLVAGKGINPGVGDFTAWVRYTDGAGNVRQFEGGVFRFR